MTFKANADVVDNACKEVLAGAVLPAVQSDPLARLVIIGYRLGNETPDSLGRQRAKQVQALLAGGSLGGAIDVERMVIASGGISPDGAMARFLLVRAGAQLPEGLQSGPPRTSATPRPGKWSRKMRKPPTGAEAAPMPVPAPRLKYQEDVNGEYPNRMETRVANTVSLRFVRKLVAELQPVDTAQTSGKRTDITQTTRPVAGRDVTVPLEQVMGDSYEPWIRATLTSTTIEAQAKSAEMADWRRLNGQDDVFWEWEIQSRSPLSQQELKAAIEIEWRLKSGGAGNAKRHLLWENVLQIAVENTVIKKYQLQTATPVFSIAGGALLVAAALPRRRRREGEEDEPDSSPLPAAPQAAGQPEPGPAAEPARVAVQAGPEGDASAQQDVVECSVFAPPSAGRSATLMVQVFAHLREQAEEAARMAAEFDEEARRRAVKTLASKIARGSELMFDLAIGDWEIPDPVQTLIWNGNAESVQFTVDVPADCKPGNVACKLTVSQNSIPLGHISFMLKVTASAEAADAPPQAVPAGADAKRYSYAFVSYASPDRSEVLERVQMLETMGIRYFQDVLSLDPGDRWERKLYENIDRCDLFLLFWSKAAKESPWVMKEVEYALGRKKGDFDASPEIKPVIIEGPPLVSPPESLKALHFNDRLLYFINPKR